MVSYEIKVDNEPAPIELDAGYLVVRESLDFFVPSGTLVFRDRISGFVSIYPVMQNTEVQISVDDGTSIQTSSFLAFSDVKTLSVQGVEAYDYKLDLLSKFSSPLLTGSEYHSKKCSASDYIRYIAGKCGLDVEVESTKGSYSWVNPNWKFAQMVRYLAQRAEASTGSCGFVYFVGRDGVLVFKSVDKLYEEDEGVDITVGSYVEEVEGEEETKNNKSFTIKDNHFANVALGANMVELEYYDYKASGYHSEVVAHDRFIKKKGQVRGVAVGMENMGPRVYVGEFTEGGLAKLETCRKVYNKVIRQFETTQIQVVVPWNNELSLGRVVNLSVPANEEIVQGGVNMNYSGRYLVKALTSVGSENFYMKVLLVRPGRGIGNSRKSGYF